MNIRTIFVTVIGALALTVFIVACKQKAKETSSVADVTEIPVKLFAAQNETVSEPVVAPGFISSATEARLSFKTGGVIERIYVEEGQAVHKGQLLATINLTEINAMVEQAKEGLEKAQRDYDRTKNLYKDTVASLEQFQNVTTGLNVAKQQYEMAKFNQSYAEIRATTAGTNDWLVKVGIADRDWARLKLGNTAIIKIDAYPGENFSGMVSQLAQAPDAMSGLYQVEIKLNGCSKALATGLFAKAEINPNSDASYVTIPVDAVIEGNGSEAFVYTATDNKAHKQPVRIAFMKDGKVMLASGLEKGTKVVTDGSAYLTDGVGVKIVD